MSDKRLQCNRNILVILADLVEKCPDLRFGQILFNAKVIDHINSENGPIIKDPFYEESCNTLKRIESQDFVKIRLSN